MALPYRCLNATYHDTITRKEAVHIAWIDGKWLNDEERTEALAVHDEYLREVVVPQHGDDPMDWPEDARELLAVWSRLERVSRCHGNLLEFAIEYFSEARNPGNDGNWDGFDITNVDEAPEFHREIADIMNDVSAVRTNDKVAVAAPRSHAKSSYLSKAFPVHEILYRLRKYVIIISETPTVSTGNMQWIRDQLKHNAKLRADFGPLLSPQDQANIRDNSESFIAWHTDEGNPESKRQVALVEAASTGQALRGRNWNGSRPDLIICDDLEDARPGGNASTPEQREKLRNWFSQTVIPLGDPKGARTAFVYMGTTVSPDALLVNVLYNRSDFRSKVYRAIVSEPVNAELWEQCRQIYVDRNNANRAEDARKFYEDNREAMDEGAAVLWPQVQSLYRLMAWKWDNGSKAFNTEYMNNPIDEESMIFNPKTFTYYDGTIDITDRNYTISMGVDFAMGKERGDFSAIAIVAKDRTSGVKYVLEAWGARVKPDAFIEIIVNYVRDYQPDVIAAEAQAAQEFFVDELKKRLAGTGYPAATRVKNVVQRSRKELRIEAMLPDIENGGIQFNRAHALLLEQFEIYPQGHDDLPDALEMAITAVDTRKATIQPKPAWM